MITSLARINWIVRNFGTRNDLVSDPYFSEGAGSAKLWLTMLEDNAITDFLLLVMSSSEVNVYNIVE